VTFDKRSLQTIYAALHAAIQWELDLAEAYGNLKGDPAYRTALRTAKKYGRIRLQIAKALSRDLPKGGK